MNVGSRIWPSIGYYDYEGKVVSRMDLIVCVPLKLLNKNVSLGIRRFMNDEASCLPDSTARANKINSPGPSVINRLVVHRRRCSRGHREGVGG
jgi:hypothetical protein